jgi:PAS domain S-box-containing protein
MDATRAAAARFTSRFRVTATLVVVLSLTAAGALLWTQWASQEDLRQQLVEQSQKRAVQLGEVLAGRIEALIGSADFGLVQAREEFGIDEGRFRTTIALLARSFPDDALLQISVAAADGALIWSNLGLTAPVNIRDRDHFKVHLGGADRLYVSKPLVGRVSGVWSVQFSRPVLRAGRFAGVIVLSIRPEFLAKALASMQTSPGDVMSLLNRDGAYIARSRDLEQALGHSVPRESPLLRPDALSRGVFRTTSRLDGTDRILSWHAIAGTDLVVVAGLDMSTLLAPVERQIGRDTSRTAVIALLLMALGASIAVLLLRLTREVEIARQARITEDRLTNAIEHLNEPVVLTDADDRFVLTNQAFRKLNENVAGAIAPGEKFEDYLRAGIAAGNYPDAAGREESWLQERLAERRDPAGPVERVRPGDRWYQITDRRLSDGGMIRFSSDITSRKRAETALRESESRFRAIFDRSLAGISLSAVDGAYLSVNQAYCDLVGYAASELVGNKKVQDLFDQRDDEFAEFFRQLRAGEIDQFDRDRRYRRRDGSELWGHVAVVSIRDAERRPVYYLAIVIDVTEVRAAREKIERMNVELEERVAARTEELRATVKEMEAFSYTVSHDLRAPLGAINGFTQLLRMKEAALLTEDGRKLLGFVETNATRMVVLVEGLLEFSRLGRQALARRQVAMGALVKEVLAELQAERKAVVRLGSLPGCDGDPLLLKQAWTNLIDNALKYSGGRAPARIEIGFEAAAAAYYVRDNGAGFNMQHAGKLFGVFERLHREDEFEGTGLGLAIVERIVRRHGGRIWAEAHPGEGATFYFTIPRGGAFAVAAAA